MLYIIFLRMRMMMMIMMMMRMRMRMMMMMMPRCSSQGNRPRAPRFLFGNGAEFVFRGWKARRPEPNRRATLNLELCS